MSKDSHHKKCQSYRWKQTIFVPVAPSGRRHFPDPGTHTVLDNILFVVEAFERSFCVSSIFHMWYLKG